MPDPACRREQAIDYRPAFTVVVQERDVCGIGTGIAISALVKGLQKNDAAKGIRDMIINFPQVGDRDRWHPAWAVPKVLS